MCFDATSCTEMFKVFVHQSGKFRVENTVSKSTKLHVSLKKSGVTPPESPSAGGMAHRPSDPGPPERKEDMGRGRVGSGGRNMRGKGERDRRRRGMESEGGN
jgi:hypothetical protein